MGNKNKDLKMRNNDSYTIMFIPRRDGKIRKINLKKQVLYFFIGLMILSIIYLATVTYINIRVMAKEILFTKEINMLQDKVEEEVQEKYALEELNECLLKEKKDILESNREMNEIITEMVKLEEVLAKELEDRDVSRKLNKSDTFAFNEYKGDLKNKIKDTIELIEKVKLESSMLRRIPSIMPTAGNITSGFGRRNHPVSGVIGKQHNGVDIANSTGTEIYATADGVVKFSGYMSGYGYLVVVDHQNGYETYYGHNSRLIAREKQVVQRGDKIALMGSTGVSTGPHCHYEVRYFGTPVNPIKFIN